MESIEHLLMLGDPRLYQVCAPVTREELSLVPGWVNDLHDVMRQVRERYHFGRAIAAPQLGIMKRLVYMPIDRPLILINPELSRASVEMQRLWDDCMSFPNLLVELYRHQEITVSYLDEHWERKEWLCRGDMAELIQHECDHLDGILCTMRAIDNQSFKWRTIDP